MLPEEVDAGPSTCAAVDGAGLLADLADAVPGDVLGVPAALERGVGDVGESVLEPEVVELARPAHVEPEPAAPARPRTCPRPRARPGELGVGRRVGEVVGEPVLGAQHHDREVEAGLVGREVRRPAVVLEVAARDPQHDPAVDDVGHVAGERREQLLVDGQRDVDARRDLGERGRVLDERP